MKERIVKLYEKMSECKHCGCCRCPSKLLLEYIEKLGIDEFFNQFMANQLPEEIVMILINKLDSYKI